ncbi:hypothetical protein AAG570_008794 [Ranatra chinensis]|uniref:Mitochondrial ribosomal protein L41 n=1 Tax=Ranatra chinensis TaxID=642074 RepID=A0ABD0Z2L0_9HEMI
MCGNGRGFVPFLVVFRTFSTSSRLLGKRNFRKFIIPNRGTEILKKTQKSNPDPRIPVYSKSIYKDGDKYVVVPEKIPELIVPDLTGFELKPYVSYRVPDIVQSEFSSKDLFNSVYAKKIAEDFKAGKLDKDGNSLEPSEEELMTPEEARIRARKTGSDIFTERSKREEEEKYLLNV